MTTTAPETFRDQVLRLELMASGSGEWDLSKNDLAALRAVLADRRRMALALGVRQGNECAAAGGITRFEVIDESGRAYTRWNTHVELSYQDNGRTLKAFIS